MDRVRYRSYLVRTWLVDRPDGDVVLVRIEWISRGAEVELRGGRAADLAARIEGAFDPKAADELTVAGLAAGEAERGGI